MPKLAIKRADAPHQDQLTLSYINEFSNEVSTTINMTFGDWLEIGRHFSIATAFRELSPSKADAIFTLLTGRD